MAGESRVQFTPENREQPRWTAEPRRTRPGTERGSAEEVRTHARPGRLLQLPGDRTGRVERARYVGSVIKKRRKRMAKKKHRKLLKRTRIQRRRAGK